MQVEGNP
jgi:hypothetical protein